MNQLFLLIPKFFSGSGKTRITEIADTKSVDTGARLYVYSGLAQSLPIYCFVNIKDKAIPLQAWPGPKVEVSRYHNTQHLKGVILLGLSAGRLGTNFCYRRSHPRTIIVAGRIMSIKIPMTPSGIVPANLGLVTICLNRSIAFSWCCQYKLSLC
jgi:hypothetical protein